MRFHRALENAAYLAAEKGEDYVAIRARNGQWMVERGSFVDGPVGRLLYEGKEKVRFEARRLRH